MSVNYTTLPFLITMFLAAWLIPAETYEWLMDKLEDAELAESSAI